MSMSAFEHQGQHRSGQSGQPGKLHNKLLVFHPGGPGCTEGSQGLLDIEPADLDEVGAQHKTGPVEACAQVTKPVSTPL